ncbi:hypothetical protein JL721_13089 [Aureococcus anophagefferens]|nr:hypothetical protein JL721_13089 [Aureococcus anophagefferens]
MVAMDLNDGDLANLSVDLGGSTLRSAGTLKTGRLAATEARRGLGRRSTVSIPSKFETVLLDPSNDSSMFSNITLHRWAGPLPGAAEVALGPGWYDVDAQSIAAAAIGPPAKTALSSAFIHTRPLDFELHDRDLDDARATRIARTGGADCIGERPRAARIPGGGEAALPAPWWELWDGLRDAGKAKLGREYRFGGPAARARRREPDWFASPEDVAEFAADQELDGEDRAGRARVVGLWDAAKDGGWSRGGPRKKLFVAPGASSRASRASTGREPGRVVEDARLRAPRRNRRAR